MPGGYAGKFLDVDLSKETVKDTVIDDETLEAYFGGSKVSICPVPGVGRSFRPTILIGPRRWRPGKKV